MTDPTAPPSTATDPDDPAEHPSDDAASATSAAAIESGRANSVWVWALITLATVIAVVSALNTWAERQLLDTDNWVEASGALLENDDIRRQVANKLVTALYEGLEVGDAIDENLPDALKGLGNPLAAVIRGPLVETVDALLASDVVQETWRDANRLAHSTIKAILEDDVGPGLSTADGVVTLDLGELVRLVGQQVGIPDDALDAIPDDAGQIELVQSNDLETAQTAVQAIQVLSVLLVIVVVGLYALAIYLATNWRREATRNVGLAIALGGFVLLVMLRLITGWVTDGAETENGRVTAEAVLTIATAILSRSGWAGIFVGLLIALFASLVGPARLARRARHYTAAGFRRQAVAMWILLAVVVLLLLAWGPVSAPDNWFTVLLVVALVVIGVEALRRTSLAEAAETQGTDTQGSDADTAQASTNRSHAAAAASADPGVDDT